MSNTQKLQNIRTVILDFDFTLWDHRQDIFVKHFFHFLSPKQIQKAQRQFCVVLEKIPSWVKGLKVDPELVLACIEKYMPIFNCWKVKHERLTPRDFMDYWLKMDVTDTTENAVEVVRNLYDRGYTIVGLTDWFWEAQIKILKKHGFYPYFHQIFTCDNWFFKPDKRSMERIFEYHDRSGCIMVGDGLETDIEIANRCQIPSVYLNRLGIDYENKEQEPTYVISRLEELLDILP